MMRFLAFIICAVIVVSASGQNMHAKVEIPPVVKDGFYRIEIRPDVAAMLTESFANLRITGPDGSFVPYFIESNHEYSYREFIPYEIRRNEQKAGCCTELVLENTTGASITNLHLKIRNADVRKKASLAGSDDGNNWFVLKETIVFTAISNASETSEVRVVDFPLSDYRFYKLSIADSVSAPLNIIDAGYYRHVVRDGVYTPLEPKIAINQDATRQRTIIKVSFDTLQWVDRIIVNASGFPVFDREATIYSLLPQPDNKKTISSFVSRFRITHREPVIIDTEDLKAAELQISVENGDNPPLTFDAIDLQQLRRFAVAHLRSGGQYELQIGPKAMTQPNYDLQRYRDEVREVVSVIEPGAVTLATQEDEPDTTFFTREFMWIAIVAIILVLGFFSYRMVKEGGVSSK
ncbi:MAG TPA: hypothetical protein VKZ68_03605 [Ohtaekwangia sp.]|nr:hypothetical protein [Ohtaekwangia sp.]